MVADERARGLSEWLAGEGEPHLFLGTGGENQRLTVVPVSLAKGLEFDYVVVAEPADIVAGEPAEWQGLRRLYVVLTRAVSGLTVVHAQPLPSELRDRPAA